MQLLTWIFGDDNYLATVPIRSKPQGRAVPSGFSPNHEYALFYGNTDLATVGRLPRDDRQLQRYSEKDENGIYAWSNFRGTGANSWKTNRPKLFYPIFVKSSGEIEIPNFDWDDNNNIWSATDPVPGAEKIFPIDENGVERVWTLGWERAKKEKNDLLEARKVNGGWQIYRKYRPNQDGALPGTWWDDPKYSASESGTKVLKDLFIGLSEFSYPKSIYTVMDCLRASNLNNNNTVLDYFGGSGTTGHATINLNREDGGRRKFILVEMADYFDTVLLPRIKKVTFSPEWKDGKPKRMATAEEAERSPRIVKVIRLESYEDALNNIAFDDPSGQQAMQFEDYLLQYMLKWETRHSETLLNVEQLTKPFSYQLHIHRDGETRTQAVDLPETFAYLLGLNVRKRQVTNDSDRRYLVYRGNTREGRRVAVIWRETEGWKDNDYTRDKVFVIERKLTEGADDVYVNGDSYIPGARALEPLFKARMFADVEA
jgi:adenine-specific DNA-methyltransferase